MGITPQYISAKENPSVKFYRKLSESKKTRTQEKCFVLEGYRLVSDALKNGAEITMLFITENAYERFGEELCSLSGEVTRVLCITDELGKYMAEMVTAKGGYQEKDNFNPRRTGIVRVAELSIEERTKLIQEKPEYGSIVCRCENISEGEIIDAITRTLGARSLDGIKRRVRQGMGRCQAGFCTPRTMNILSRETGIPMEKICKNRAGSELLTEEA